MADIDERRCDPAVVVDDFGLPSAGIADASPFFAGQGDSALELDGPTRQLMDKILQETLVEPSRSLNRRRKKNLRLSLVELGFWLVAQDQSEEDRRNLELVAKAVELLHCGSLVIDDIQDDSGMRRGGPTLHRQSGVPAAICAGNWLYFWPLRLLRSLDLEPSAIAEAERLFTDTVEHAHYGQALDLKLNLFRIGQGSVAAACQQVMAHKTGALTALAVQLGALCAHSPDKHRPVLAEVGRNLGVSLQAFNDLADANPRKEQDPFEDFYLRRPNFVWGWMAQNLPTPAYGRFLDVVADARTIESDLENFFQEFSVLEGARQKAASDLEYHVSAVEMLRSQPGFSTSLEASQAARRYSERLTG